MFQEVVSMKTRTRWILTSAGLAGSLLLPAAAEAQLSDLTQTPNAANGMGVPGEGIRKSYDQEIGAGRGDVNTPGSSIFIIKRDPFRAIRRGRQIFQRKFTRAQGQGPRTNDGVSVPLDPTGAGLVADPSPIAGLADSCAGCHGRPRGSAGHGGDVFTRPDSRDAPHLFGLGIQEMLGDEITSDLRQTRSDAQALAAALGSAQTLPLSSKGISYGSITANPDGSVDTSGVVGVNADLRVRPFFAQGGTISIREFLVGAFNAEMGVEAFDPDLQSASSHGVVITPAGMVLDGTKDTVEGTVAQSLTDDPDGDGVVNELPQSIVDFEEFYLLNYFRPAVGRQTTESTLGRIVFNQIGCGSCHISNLTIDRDRRVADVDTSYNAAQGNPFNHLFATATPRLTAVDDLSGFPTIKNPSLQPFLVRNFFADLKRHDVGKNFYERNFNGTLTAQFVTEPLWGVATTAPYGHDGRTGNLEEVILRHGGEALTARNAFAALPATAQSWVQAFLGTLVLFAPDDTASNLSGANPANPDYPQRGHGAIALTVLFNDTTDVE
jgi:hypothetical protein